jgi:hypothetical protein
MNVNDDGRLDRWLAALPSVRPNEARASRARERCLRAWQTAVHSGRRRRLARRRIEAAVIGGFSLLYAASVAIEILHWRGIL